MSEDTPKFEVHCTSCGLVGPELVVKNFRVQARCKGCQTTEFIKMNQSSRSFVMPFGKHQGVTLGEILKRDPLYVSWAAGNFNDEKIKKKLKEVLRDG